MKIREADHSDISGILRVLKASLGETSSKKTERVWYYKHINNPFGESLVLVAEEENEIIGVRAFMRWKWQRGEQVYSAFRAVDTATHPDHQGKGIFKKLTLKALGIGRLNGDHFVFNTPNAQSKPGYLKMGWKEVGKLKIQLVPLNPLYWKKKSITTENNITINDTDNSSMLNIWDEELKRSGKLYTPKTSQYLKWRYLDNPLKKYKIKSENEFFIAGYVKQHNRFKELRISELIFTSDASIKIIKKTIFNWAKESGVHFISLQTSGEETIFHWKISGNFGPILTFKMMNESIEESTFLHLGSWQYSLGDLELF